VKEDNRFTHECSTVVVSQHCAMCLCDDSAWEWRHTLCSR